MNFRKDPLFILLVITMLCIGGSICYFGRDQIFGGVNQVHTATILKTQSGNKDQDAITVNTLDTAQYNIDTIIASNNSLLRDTSDLLSKKKPLQNIVNQPPVAAIPTNPLAPEITSLVPPEDSPAFKKAYSDRENEHKPLYVEKLISVSDNENVVCQLKGGKSQKLIVYPSRNAWKSIYLIAPVTDKKLLVRKNIIQPEFEGVNYPIYKQAKLTYNGKKYDIVQITFPSTAVDAQHPYSILLQYNSSFLIFGEQKSAEWSVYENGRVAKFNPPKDFLITEN